MRPNLSIGRIAAAALLALAAGGVAAADQSAAPVPFDFRGLALGMSLAEFRAAHPPVDDPQGARARCATLLDPEDQRRVVIRCDWVHRAGGGRLAPNRLLLGDIPANSYYFVFFGGRHGAADSLRQISISMPGAARTRTFRRLRERFGEPDLTDVDDNLWLARWSNGVSSVCLRSSVVDASTTLTYLLRPDC